MSMSGRGRNAVEKNHKNVLKQIFPLTPPTKTDGSAGSSEKETTSTEKCSDKRQPNHENDEIKLFRFFLLLFPSSRFHKNAHQSDLLHMKYSCRNGGKRRVEHSESFSIQFEMIRIRYLKLVHDLHTPLSNCSRPLFSRSSAPCLCSPLHPHHHWISSNMENESANEGKEKGEREKSKRKTQRKNR